MVGFHLLYGEVSATTHRVSCHAQAVLGYKDIRFTDIRDIRDIRFTPKRC